MCLGRREVGTTYYIWSKQPTLLTFERKVPVAHVGTINENQTFGPQLIGKSTPEHGAPTGIVWKLPNSFVVVLWYVGVY